MTLLISVLPVFLALVCSSGASTPEKFNQRLLEAASKYEYYSKASRKAITFSDETGLPGGFQCPLISPSPVKPTDAKKVRVSDINVVAALGDSLTAANGAKAWTVPGVLRQYRGVSWSIGGDENVDSVLTMPNILRKYNPKLYGYSTGASFSSNYKGARYNVAVPGNTAADLIDQARNLIEKLTADGKQNDWKLITIFIGGNDICEYCDDDTYSPENFKLNVETVIDMLYESFNNTIINLASPPDLTQVSQLPDGFSCKAVHRLVCACAHDKADPGYASRVSYEFQDKMIELLAAAPRRWPMTNFGISYQPQFARLDAPLVDGEIDLSYMAPDCFHLSQKGHAAAGATLWNNMLTPREERVTNVQYHPLSIICPSEDAPYILL